MKRSLVILFTLIALLFAAAQTEKEKCVQACKDDNRFNVRQCNVLYPPESQAVKHRECLDKAKNTFDTCMARCD